MGLRTPLAFALITGLFLSLMPQAQAQSFSTEDYNLNVVTVTDGLEHPWGLAFLPDAMMIVTERDGDVRLIDADGTKRSPLKGLPEVDNGGQGGMLDVALDPDFSKNNLIYLSYSEPGKGGSGTAVASAVLDIAGNQITDLKVVFQQLPKSDGGRHYGSRLVFADDGNLFITIGERGERDRTQDFTINRGQVIRIRPDGSIPDDNPFVGRAGYRPEVWSYGHRNPQGASINPRSRQLWTVEHGARGGDEVNIPQAGKNYGWPVIAYGKHYFGGSIGEGNKKGGMEQPVFYWDPSIAPSGMDFYSGDKFPKWKNNLFVAALKFELVSRLILDGDKVVREERILDGFDERIRHVRQGPDGYLYLLTDDGDGRILRVEPR